MDVRSVHDGVMTEISTAQLRDNLAHWIWQVGQTREEITITSRGRPVAALAPHNPTADAVALLPDPVDSP